MKKSIIILMVLIFLSTLAYAHQPRIVTEELTQIQNPEISQAFYGILEGRPENFQIRSDVPFKMYVQILVPAVQNIGKDISVEVKKDKQFLFLLNGLEHQWTYFHEEFAGDNYYQGPEKEINVGPGAYNLKVFSSDNQGKYVLVVGRIESFPLKEWINTIVTLPKLKTFFEKPSYTAFFNLIGLFLLIMILIVLAIILFVIWLYKKYRKKPARNKKS